MSRVASGGVFYGGISELSMTLGNLSADGWGCVPILLAVWLEALGPGLGRKMATSSTVHINEYLAPPSEVSS